MVSAYKIKARNKCDLDSDKLNSCTVPSYHVARDMLHVICTRLSPGHLSICVGDSLPRTEVIVKKNLELRKSM